MMDEFLSERCTICSREDSHFSPLFDENLCDECVEWAIKNGVIPRTDLAEQYAEYVKSFPLNDPRD